MKYYVRVENIEQKIIYSFIITIKHKYNEDIYIEKVKKYLIKNNILINNEDINYITDCFSYDMIVYDNKKAINRFKTVINEYKQHFNNKNINPFYNNNNIIFLGMENIKTRK